MTRNQKPEPWIETPQGGLFFVNALLVAPEFVVLFPLCLQLLAGLIAEERAPSPFLDTIPFVASHAIPYLGWFVVIPIWTVVKNLRMDLGLLPRTALGVFLLSHLGFLGYTILSWVG
jgi:hypothetical protein